MHARVRSSVSLFLSLTLLIMLAGPALAVTPAPGSPGLSLGRELSGEEAIRVLGADLAKVAAAHGKTTAALAKALRSDKRLFVDANGALLYREAPAGTPLGAPVPVDATTTGAADGAADAFSLHSKPDAKRVIYLDFDGHTLSGTAWNSSAGIDTIVAPAWDVEGGPAVFTDAERTTIAQIWARVAEDYAPFDVDVTTAYPGEDRMTRSSSSDEHYGVRALISPISGYFGTYGGIAYVGVFDYTLDSYKPALIFPENLANSEKNIAEACSHEVGHTLGLLHDGTTAGAAYYAGHGTGETGWAPIMGNGYYRTVTQWSRGEYAGANNTEDDLTIIQANGLAYRADDHADSAAGATALVATPTFTASGVIGHPGDVDTLSISVGAGQFSAQVAPVTRGPDLDVSLELRATDGTLVASAQPATALAAAISTPVAAGTYTLFVRGVGTGDPTTGYSDYASFGQWTLTGTAVPGESTPPPPPPAAPVAAFSASVTQGVAPLAVALDGSGSTDSDGSIVSYAWSFGDGTSGAGVTASHTYTAAGTYTASLTVTDSQGLTGTTSKQVVVSAPNAAPVARISATPVSGTAPLAVAFSGGTSSDQDGSVVSYAWSFGDGSYGTGVAPSHTYTTAGTFTARLTVTDNAGATASATAKIVVAPAVAVSTLHIAEIAMTAVTVKNDRYAQTKVLVVDGNGQAVAGATVKAAWSGLVTGTSTGTTGADGTVLLLSKRTRKSGTITFTVTSIAKAGSTYAVEANAITQSSLLLSTIVSRTR